MEGARVSLLGAQMPGPDPTPTSGRVLLGGPPIVQHVLKLPESRQAAASVESGCGHLSSGVTGLDTWAAGQGPGGAGWGSGAEGAQR